MPTEQTSGSSDLHGQPIKPDMVPHMKQAILKIVGGGPLAAKQLHDEIVAKTGGQFRQAAATALVLAAKRLDNPFDPQHEDPAGDVPTEAEAQAEQQRMETNTTPEDVTEEAVAGLGDEVLTAWLEAGISETEATKIVQGHLRGRTLVARWNGLNLSLQKAKETKATKEAVSK